MTNHPSQNSLCVPTRCVTVQVPLAVPQVYDYRVPDSMEIVAGSIVRVGFGKREVDAVAWDAPRVLDESHPQNIKLKPLLKLYDIPPMPQDMRDFIERMADYVMSPCGVVLRLAMRVPKAFEPPSPQSVYRSGAGLPARMSDGRKRVFAYLAEGVASAADIRKQAGVSTGVIRALVRGGHLIEEARISEAVFVAPCSGVPRLELNEAQAGVAGQLELAVRGGVFSVHLIDGVTGSGKTEVYFEAVNAALVMGKQVLVLLPEIALTAQFIERFAARFEHEPVLWHAALSDGARARHWRGVARGDVRVVVGARSALFLPWQDLGTIIVDEEHDSSFKQEEGVIYNARDMAVLRGQYAQCAVILSSATPSFESRFNAQNGRYQLHYLPDRFGAANLPDIELIDMRINPPAQGEWLAPPLLSMLAQSLAAGTQSLLFLNRRGFAPLMLCRACGYRYACELCDSWMVMHRFSHMLMCHHCGGWRKIPDKCDICEAEDRLAACGPGVERILQEVKEHFPQARAEILSSDHATTPAVLAARIVEIEAGAIDIIIGTQMVAKGHHFPRLGFVGVVDADLGLGNGDLRASEHTFQLLSQVAGRAGRAAVSGRVMLQSHQPEHPVLQALQTGTRAQFIDCEMAARQTASMPPYGRLAALIISGADAEATRHFAARLKAAAPHHDAITLLGPAPAPIAKLRNRYRHRFLLKAAKRSSLHAFLRQWLAQLAAPTGIKIAIDIDPQSFM